MNLFFPDQAQMPFHAQKAAQQPDALTHSGQPTLPKDRVR